MNDLGCLVAGLAPPFDRGVRHGRLREVVHQHFRLSGGAIGEAVAQYFRDAAMQRLAPALEKVLIGCILNECVLETIIALGRQALDQHNVGVGKLFQRSLQRCIAHACDRA
jgi:hypothetical protein